MSSEKCGGACLEYRHYQEPPFVGRIGAIRVGEEVSLLTPHRPGRAQLRHPVLHPADSLTVWRSYGQSVVAVTEIVGVFPQRQPMAESVCSTVAITTFARCGRPGTAGSPGAHSSR